MKGKEQKMDTWSGYLSIVCVAVSYFVGKEILGDALFSGVILVLAVITIPAMLTYYFLSKEKSDSKKRNIMIIISSVLILLMIAAILLNK